MVVAQNILSAEKHLELRVFKSGSQLAQSLPRIFFQETEGSVEGSSSPALHCMIPHLIHLVDDGKHLLCCHPSGDQRLVGVTQDSFHNLDRLFLYLSHEFLYLLKSFSLSLRYTPKIAMKVPAATAVPITPATFGPMACISRKFVGSASAPTF